MQTNILKHKLSQSRKLADKAKWGRQYMDYISPTYLGNSTRWENTKRLAANYKLYNNEIDQDEFAKWCSPFGIDVGQYQEEIMPFNKIPNKANILIG